MKQTFSVNVGGRAYSIDEDAYELLDRYFRDIESRLKGVDAESMEDIEARVADIFDERIVSQMQVVSADMVCRAMAVIGRPEVFGGAGGGQNRGLNRGQNRESGADGRGQQRLLRSSDDKMIGGVCGGMADYFGVDPVIVRLIALCGLILAGATLWAYIILWIVVPMAPKNKKL